MLIKCLSVLSSLFAFVPMISRKDLRTAYITSKFCVLCVGESVPELGREVQEVSGWL